MEITNAALIEKWQDAWGHGVLDNQHAKNCGWNASLIVLAIALHGIGQRPDPKERYAFGLNHEKANAFMTTMNVEQRTNLLSWLNTKKDTITTEQYSQLQNMLIQLDLGVLPYIHLRNVPAWWQQNKEVTKPIPALEIPESFDERSWQ